MDSVNVKHSTGPQSYRVDIDVLRAFAVMSVVLFHGFPDWIPGGYVGVDIFFVISGYLISGHMLERLYAGKFSYVDFYIRRIRRIFPALILVLLVTLGAAYFFMFSTEYAALGKDTLAASLFVSNIFLSTSQDYFAQASGMRALLHLWSLGVEEQFYLFWPIILVVLWRLKLARRSIALGVGLIFVGSLAISVIFTPLHPTAAFYLPVTRFWEFLLGTFLAWFNLVRSSRQDSANASDDREGLAIATTTSLHHAFSWLGFLLIVGPMFAFNSDTVFPGWTAALPAIGAVLIIAAGPQAFLNRGLSVKPIVYLGLISYPLYLWHWPVLVAVRLLTGVAPTIALGLASTLASIVLASLTFHFVEKPVRFGAAVRGRSNTVAAVLLVLMVIVGASGYLIDAFKGLPNRFTGADFGAGNAHSWAADSACLRQFPGADHCRSTAPDREPDVVLLGDSHANHLFDGLAEEWANTGVVLLSAGRGNCPPIYDVNVKVGTYDKHCPSFVNKALDTVVANPHVKSVILSSYAVSTIKGGLDLEERDFIKMTSAVADSSAPQDKIDLYVAALEHTVRRLRESGKSVVVVLDNPEIDFDPSACAKRPLAFPAEHVCAISRQKIDARLSGITEKIKGMLGQFEQGVKVFNPLDAMCDKDVCYAKRDQQILYADRDHLSVAGSVYLAKRLAPVVLR